MTKRVGYIKVDNTRPRQEVTVSGNLNKTILITLGDTIINLSGAHYGHYAIGIKGLNYWQKIMFLYRLRKWL